MNDPRSRARVILPAILAAFLGCTGHRDLPLSESFTSDDELPGLVVSESRAVAPPSTRSAMVQITDLIPVAYLSLAPETVPEGVGVEIRNLTSGDPSPVLVPLVDGGFDPVPIPARAGDELQLLIRLRGEQVIRSRSRVPPRRRPTIVRTTPPRDRTDVALSIRMEVVFSEPVDPRTLSPMSVQLWRAGILQPATVGPAGDTGLRAEMVPDSALSPSSTYEMVITTDVRDMNGDALEEPVRIEFTTQPPGTGTVMVSNTTTGGAFDPDGYRLTVGDSVPLTQILELNDSLRLVNLPAGQQVIGLEDVASNCSIAGGLRRVVTIPEGGIARLDLESSCTPSLDLRSLRLVFARQASVLVSHIFTMNADGTELRQITDGQSYDAGPSVSPDGSRIAFMRDQDGYVTLEPELYLVQADGSGVVRVDPATPAYNPAWSPDGTQLVFSAGWPGAIRTARPDGSAPPITLTTGANQWPAWSPRGDLIAFNRGVPISDGPDAGTLEWGIWTMRPDGNGLRRVRTLGCCVSSPVWSPDGDRIAFIKDLAEPPVGQGAVLVMTLDGVIERQLPLNYGWSDHWHMPFAWLPDGTRMALTRHWFTGGRWREDLYLLSTEDGGLTRITADGVSGWAAFFP